MSEEELKANAERGEAMLMCAGYCQQESGPYPGVMSREERGDEGRIFFPDALFHCHECDTDEFCWLEFKCKA